MPKKNCCMAAACVVACEVSLAASAPLSHPVVSSYPEMVMVASNDAEDERIVIAVRPDGAFSYQQFSEELLRNSYGRSKFTDAEIKKPSHYDFYDGDRKFISSAPTDPLGMYEVVTLDRLLWPGEAIQVKWCIWPLLEQLAESWSVEQVDFEDGIVAHLDDLGLAIEFDAEGRVVRNVWEPKSQSQIKTKTVWEYQDNEKFGDIWLPTKLHFEFRSVDKNNLTVAEQAGDYTLSYKLARADAEAALEFPYAGTLRRRDNKTKNVYETDGSLAYNENDMANDYLAAIGKGNPRQTRWILLSLIAVLSTGSVWYMQKKKASA